MNRAFICGCAGLALTQEERAFIKDSRPWGMILFKRNVESREQVLALANAFREIDGSAHAPVLIDQEGGRVQRLAPPHWAAYPAAARFDGELRPLRALEAAKLTARLIASDLREVGINVDCAPVLDVADELTHAVIGSRAYSKQPNRVAALGLAVMEGLIEGGVAPVMKHVPGHGRARADSHLELPVVDATREELVQRDFTPFRALRRRAPMAMTAHVVYSALDPDRPATTSPTVIKDIVRGAIGFEGLLISDDLSMKALGGPLGQRANDAFEAGVDIALHCNGQLAEARGVAEAAPELRGLPERRARDAMASIASGAATFDAAEARATLATLFADFRAA
jgi:beta-N-acetylhexosaminidase